MASNNMVLIRGTVIQAPKFSYSYNGNDFYEFIVNTKRRNGTYDFFHIVIPWSKVKLAKIMDSDHIEIECEMRSYKYKRRVIYYLYYLESKLVETDEKDCAQAVLVGSVIRKPVLKEHFFSSLNRANKVASGTIKLDSHNRYYSAPIVFWGRGAEIADEYEYGTSIRVEGLVSTRKFEYTNKETGEKEDRTQVEVTVIRSEVNNEES